MENILPESRYREINSALARVNKARLMIESAKRAGTNVDEQCMLCDYAEQRLNQLKQEHFKGKA